MPEGVFIKGDTVSSKKPTTVSTDNAEKPEKGEEVDNQAQ